MRPRHKYNAVRTVFNGRKYASKSEAAYAKRLDWLRAESIVIGWLEQVPFYFPCGNKYVSDFLVFYADGGCELVDVKGVLTPSFKIKQRLMERHFPWMPLRLVPGSDALKWVKALEKEDG